jgi:hypothetical protein
MTNRTKWALVRIGIWLALFLFWVAVFVAVSHCQVQPDTVWVDTTYVYTDSRAFIYPSHRKNPPCGDLLLHHPRVTKYVRFTPVEVTGDDMEMINILQYTSYINQVWVGEELIFILLDGRYDMRHDNLDSLFTITSVYDFNSDGVVDLSDYSGFVSTNPTQDEWDEFILIWGKPSVYEWRAK